MCWSNISAWRLNVSESHALWTVLLEHNCTFFLQVLYMNNPHEQVSMCSGFIAVLVACVQQWVFACLNSWFWQNHIISSCIVVATCVPRCLGRTSPGLTIWFVAAPGNFQITSDWFVKCILNHGGKRVLEHVFERTLDPVVWNASPGRMRCKRGRQCGCLILYICVEFPTGPPKVYMMSQYISKPWVSTFDFCDEPWQWSSTKGYCSLGDCRLPYDLWDLIPLHMMPLIVCALPLITAGCINRSGHLGQVPCLGSVACDGLFVKTVLGMPHPS